MMQDFDTLLQRLENKGLNHSQAEKCVQVIQQHITRQYPIMGTLVQGWLKKEHHSELVDKEFIDN